MAKTAVKIEAPIRDNIVQFQPRENLKQQRQVQATDQLQRESHLFIVILGTIIGACIALFIGYHVEATVMHILLLSIFPLGIAYLMRRIYIHTLMNS